MFLLCKLFAHQRISVAVDNRCYKNETLVLVSPPLRVVYAKHVPWILQFGIHGYFALRYIHISSILTIGLRYYYYLYLLVIQRFPRDLFLNFPIKNTYKSNCW